jgi:hypothetical protein
MYTKCYTWSARALAPFPLRTRTRTHARAFFKWALNMHRYMCLYTGAYAYIQSRRDTHPAVARLNREYAPAHTHELPHTRAHSKGSRYMHTYTHAYILTYVHLYL